MKNFKFIMLALMMCLSMTVFGQDTLKYSALQSGVKPKPTTGEFTFYQAKDGSVYKIGDTLTIGVPSSNKTFAFIMQGDGIITPIAPLYASASGDKTIIKRFDVVGSKKAGFYVSVRSKGFYGALTGNYSIKFEMAVENGEIKSFGMTSDEALAELKKAKDKLDLGLITQEQYDAKKAELSKFIKN